MKTTLATVLLGLALVASSSAFADDPSYTVYDTSGCLWVCGCPAHPGAKVSCFHWRSFVDGAEVGCNNPSPSNENLIFERNGCPDFCLSDDNCGPACDLNFGTCLDHPFHDLLQTGEDDPNSGCADITGPDGVTHHECFWNAYATVSTGDLWCSNQPVACYDGSGTPGVGICKEGTQCPGTSTCDGETVAKDETCDKADNDCNGIVDDGILCDEQPVCPKSGGDTEQGEPVSLLDDTTVYSRDDVAVASSLGPVVFRRHYTSADDAWMGGAPGPFGASTVRSNSAQWWDNYTTYVLPVTGPTPSWTLRTPEGAIINYSPCSDLTTSCFAEPAEDSKEVTTRLYWNATGYFEAFFPKGERYIYSSQWFPPDGTNPRYFLTRIEAPEYLADGGARVLAELSYADPAPECSTDGGAPYVSAITTVDGEELKFAYSTTLNILGSAQCVVSSVALIPHGADAGATVVQYGYSGSPGRLSSVSWPETGQTLHYSYEDTNHAPQWKVSLGDLPGTVVSLHVYTDGGVAQDISSDEHLNFLIADGGCADGGTSDNCGSRSVTSGTSINKSSGAGGASDTAVVSSYAIESTTFATTPRTKGVSYSCDPGTATCDGFQGSTEQWEWGEVSGGRVVDTAQQGKNASWTVMGYSVASDSEFADAGMSPAVELQQVLYGSEDNAGNGALANKTLAYSYGGEGQSVRGYEQLQTTETVPSVVVSGENSTVHYNYNKTTNRLESVIREGWGQAFAADLWATQKKYVGLFFLTHRGCTGDMAEDELGRTLEVHGPCEVTSATASDCDVNEGAGVPVTQYFYYPENTAGNNAGHLEKVARYVSNSGPAGCATGRALTVAFDGYDLRGHAGKLTDPNGLVTLLSYTGDNITSATRAAGTAAAQTISYTYDQGALQSSNIVGTQLFNVTCHRKGATLETGCDPTLPWSKHVYFEAKATNDSGGGYGEGVEYEYKADGTLQKESYYAANHVLERQISHDSDPAGRPTWDQYGQGPGSYTAKRVFDAESNVVGLGLPYNAPPDFCGALGNGLATSPLCTHMAYDALSRLTSIDTFPDGEPDGGVRTCLGYDSQGDLTSVDPGLTSSAPCSSPSATAARYSYDDFGNVISVEVPWAAGVARYAYDAQGNLVVEQTPGTGFGHHVRSYDLLGRLKTASFVAPSDGGTSETALYSFAYDGEAIPDPGCPSVSSSNLSGQVQVQTDSFGKTWYEYDALGRTIGEVRERGSDGCTPQNTEGTVDDNTPSTFYSYNVFSGVASIVYPHGRKVTYEYPSTTSAFADRPSSISVEVSDGGTPADVTIIDKIKWAPYGGLAGYEIVAPLAPTGGQLASVEYLHGDDSSAIPTASCGLDRPSQTNSDDTGRLRALWVSSGAFDETGAGDIYRRTYTWGAEQLSTEDTCVLSGPGDLPQREVFGGMAGSSGYDRTLRLLHASRPAGEFNERGGPFGVRDYVYDARGNRVAGLEDYTSFQNTFAVTPHVDVLSDVSRSSAPGSIAPTHFYTKYLYDQSGSRVQEKSSSPFADGSWWSGDLYFDYGPDSVHRGLEDVVATAQVNWGGTYQYFYNAQNQRWRKTYPTGESDEYFYGLNGHMLEDRGLIVPYETKPNYPIDEYVWLDGRPVAMLKSRFVGTVNSMDSTIWQRVDDLSGDCERNSSDRAVPCGVYFPISDYVGKPVVMLDSKRLISGVGDYDPFGQVNRVTYYADTPHPYVSGDNRVIAYFAQSASSGMTTELRARYAMVDTSSMSDYVYLADLSGQELTAAGHVSGTVSGGTTSGWVAVPSDGKIKVQFRANVNWTAARGVTVSGYDYHKFQTGSAPAWTPMRFPGQYYDEETDLIQNWNRFYDPSTGRYLEPEPALQDPQYTQAAVLDGMGVVVYSYAENNPLYYMDDNAFNPTVHAHDNGVVKGIDRIPSSKDGATWADASWNIPTYQKDKRTKPHACVCRAGSCSFSATVQVEVQSQIRAGRAGIISAESPGKTVGQHEGLHRADQMKGCPEEIEKIKTDGFKTRDDCETAYQAFADSVSDKLERVRAGSEIRRDGKGDTSLP